MARSVRIEMCRKTSGVSRNDRSYMLIPILGLQNSGGLILVTEINEYEEIYNNSSRHAWGVDCEI